MNRKGFSKRRSPPPRRHEAVARLYLRELDPEMGRLGRVIPIFCERETMNMDM